MSEITSPEVLENKTLENPITPSAQTSSVQAAAESKVQKVLEEVKQQILAAAQATPPSNVVFASKPPVAPMAQLQQQLTGQVKAPPTTTVPQQSVQEQAKVIGAAPVVALGKPPETLEEALAEIKRLKVVIFNMVGRLANQSAQEGAPNTTEKKSVFSFGVKKDGTPWEPNKAQV